MEFNPDPTKQAHELLFSTKKSSPIHPPLFFNNANVSRVTEHTHLGLTLDGKLSFVNHLTEKIKVARKGISLIKHFSKYLPLKTLDQMYKLTVRPHFDYCDVIYHVPPLIGANNLLSLNFLMEKIEKVQYHAALAVSGSWKGSNRNKLYEELGWESLSQRRWHRRLSQLYKIYNHQTPIYLHLNLPEVRHYNVDNNMTFHQIFCRTSKYSNSFFPDSTKKWNFIIDDFKSCTSLLNFKCKIISLVRPATKSLFGIHDPFGIRCIFQLRLNLSPLKYHKKCHNFADTPSAMCECLTGIEDTKHFLFQCPNFFRQRITLAANVVQILIAHDLAHLSNDVDLYLYGHHVIPLEDNKRIITHSVNYIKETKRFKRSDP